VKTRKNSNLSKDADKKINTNVKLITTSQKIALAFVAVVLTCAPYFRGLYFDDEALYFTTIVGILTVILALSKRDSVGETIDIVDIGFVGITVWYLVSLPFSVNIGAALLGTIRILAYCLLYYSVSRVVSSRITKVGEWLLSATGSVVVLVGIGSSIKLPYIDGSWGDVFSSSFQYHNALAGYLLMTIPVTLLLYRDSGSKMSRYFAVSALYLQLLGLLGSQSRGAYIFFALMFILILSAFTIKDMVQVAPLLIMAIIVAWKGWSLVFNAGNMGSYLVLLWPFVGVLVLVFFEIGWRFLSSRMSLKTNLILLITVGVLVLAIYGWGSIVHLNTKVIDSPPNPASTSTLLNRVMSIKLGDQYVQERLIFYKNAWQMAIERPLVGYGANGWLSVYKGFQDYIYYSTETHSQPIKVLVDAGFVGLLFYLLIWLGVFWKVVKSWKDRHLNRGYLIGIGLLGIFLHSLMDFDLSESSIFLAMVLLIASLRTGTLVTEQTPLQKSGTAPMWKFPRVKNIQIIVALSGVVLVIGSLVLLAGQNYQQQGNDAIKNANYDEAVRSDRLALQFNPFLASAKMDLAQIELAQALQTEPQDPVQIEKVLNDLKSAVELNAMEPSVRSYSAQGYYAAGHPELAYIEAKKHLELADLYPTGYEELAQYTLFYAESLITQGRTEDANNLLQSMIELPKRVNARLSRVPSSEMKLWISEPHLSVTPLLNMRVGQAKSLQGNTTEALTIFTSISPDQAIYGEALLWKGIIESIQSDPKGERDISKAIELNPDLKGAQERIQPLLLGNKHP